MLPKLDLLPTYRSDRCPKLRAPRMESLPSVAPAMPPPIMNSGRAPPPPPPTVLLLEGRRLRAALGGARRLASACAAGSSSSLYLRSPKDSEEEQRSAVDRAGYEARAGCRDQGDQHGMAWPAHGRARAVR